MSKKSVCCVWYWILYLHNKNFCIEIFLVEPVVYVKYLNSYVLLYVCVYQRSGAAAQRLLIWALWSGRAAGETRCIGERCWSVEVYPAARSCCQGQIRDLQTASEGVLHHTHTHTLSCDSASSSVFLFNSNENWRTQPRPLAFSEKPPSLLVLGFISNELIFLLLSTFIS